ncbi:hypothetical protein MUP77_23775 [Candidatus Bathyarchaeota archaeon]|nr:hypothetical protein [Candidatus Bathyarchaeota archaeon]
MNHDGWTQSSIMEEIQEQIKHRLSIKYNWKRTPHSMLERLEKRVGKIFFKTTIPLEPPYSDEKLGLGSDDLGRDVASGLREYTRLLLNRGVQLNTLVVLGSRAKGRSRPESDIDVTIIAGNLPGRSSSEFSNIPQKILNLRRRLVLSDAPIFIGVQPSSCGSKEEFVKWLDDFRLSALDAVYYGKVIYDDGFWKQVLTKFKEIEDKYQLHETNVKELLLPL